MTNEELTRHILAQQEQLGQLASMVNTFAEANGLQTQVVSELQQQILGYGAAFQVFGELVMGANPAVKEFVANATTQMLARPETMGKNESLQQMVQALHEVATSPSRTTPEGRRAHFQVVPGGEQNGEH